MQFRVNEGHQRIGSFTKTHSAPTCELQSAKRQHVTESMFCCTPPNRRVRNTKVNAVNGTHRCRVMLHSRAFTKLTVTQIETPLVCDAQKHPFLGMKNRDSRVQQYKHLQDAWRWRFWAPAGASRGKAGMLESPDRERCVGTVRQPYPSPERRSTRLLDALALE